MAPIRVLVLLGALILCSTLACLEQPSGHGSVDSGGRDSAARDSAGDSVARDPRDDAGGDTLQPPDLPDGAPAADTGGQPNLTCDLAWSSGFEQGFPGEWLDYDNGSYSASGTMPAGRVSAWTIIDKHSGEPVRSGQHSYKGWITGAAGESHRAYPGIHTDIATPIVNTFWVYLDADYGTMSPPDWIHFGTWGNWDPKTDAGQWALHTMSVRDSKLEFAHGTPHSGEYIGPSPRPDFPLRQWVRFTMYIHYQGADGFVQVWQDGVAMLRATLPKNPGTRLRTAHWGMYASASVKGGVQYNDDIAIWRLPQPLADLSSEPRCDF
jgi:hypothetical protein